MNLRHPKRTKQAMTLFEVVVLIIIIVLLAMMFLPMLSAPRRHSALISCPNNLKQLALAYKIWAGDNHDKYPMEISVTNGGTMELMNTPDAWKAYQVISNELSTPKIIICPEDPLRNRFVTSWGDDLKTNISYFIGIDATDSNPQAIMSGDGNFLLNGSPANHGFVNAADGDALTLDTTRHISATKKLWFIQKKTAIGYIGLCDGSVQTTDNSNLTNYLHLTGFATNRFFVP